LEEVVGLWEDFPLECPTEALGEEAEVVVELGVVEATA
jgi:hypothetical protein